MHCYIHPEKDAVGTCVSCGKFICAECNTEIAGKNHCKQCTAEIVTEHRRKIEKLEESKNQQQPMVFMNAGGGGGASSSSSSAVGIATVPVASVGTKSRVVAAILAFFLGGIGIHKFYTGRIGWGIVYILFCWTWIPLIVAIIEGIIYLCMTDKEFNAKYG